MEGSINYYNVLSLFKHKSLAYYQEQIFTQPAVIHALNYLANKLLEPFFSHKSTPFKSYRNSAGFIINNADVSIFKKQGNLKNMINYIYP